MERRIYVSLTNVDQVNTTNIGIPVVLFVLVASLAFVYFLYNILKLTLFEKRAQFIS